jgi:hypothetical protein
MIRWIAANLISRGEKRTGVKLDYARKILATNTRLFLRYGKIFAFLDPNAFVPTDAYHAARICGAMNADCGTCVEAEVNLAQRAGVSDEVIRGVLNRDAASLGDKLAAVVELSLHITRFEDNPVARENVVLHYGETGLIELAYAMNGAALLPGIKRAMGYATSCDLRTLQKRIGQV